MCLAYVRNLVHDTPIRVTIRVSVRPTIRVRPHKCNPKKQSVSTILLFRQSNIFAAIIHLTSALSLLPSSLFHHPSINPTHNILNGIDIKGIRRYRLFYSFLWLIRFTTTFTITSFSSVLLSAIISVRATRVLSAKRFEPSER